MINFGFYRGKNLPYVRIPLQPLDWLLEGISILILVAIGALIFLSYDNTVIANKQFFTLGIGAFFATVVILGLTHCSIRVINFPVKITDYNMYTQSILAFRTIRIFVIEINMIFFCIILDGISPIWMLNENIINYILYATIVFMILTFAGYYFLAFKFK